MQNFLINKNHPQITADSKHKLPQKKISRQFSENKKSAKHIKIKVLPAKFIEYLNQLNSSIGRCKQKFNIKHPLHSNEQRRKSTDSSDQNSVCSRRTNQSFEKKKLPKQQFTIQYGNKVNGKLSGNVKLKFLNGAIFRGIMEDGDLKQGNIKFADGAEYNGELKNFLFHGHGRLTNKNGIHYIGVFNNGCLQKNAQIVYDNGDRYKGQILNYKKHGQGELKMKNGNRFVGQFIEGQITGFGTYFVNQFPLAVGEWKNGNFLGKGVESQTGTLKNSSTGSNC